MSTATGGRNQLNYRLVDISFKRFLGRATYGKDEQIAWSIVIPTRGFNGFIDALVDSDEYRQNWGLYQIPPASPLQRTSV